jgi:hypothetical protein
MTTKKTATIAAAVALAGSFVFVSAGLPSADAAARPTAHVPGEKIDSGLGDLPHYRDWKDPTGKAPMGKKD